MRGQPSPEHICTTTHGLDAQDCHVFETLFLSLNVTEQGISLEIPSLLSYKDQSLTLHNFMTFENIFPHFIWKPIDDKKHYFFHSVIIFTITNSLYCLKLNAIFQS